MSEATEEGVEVTRWLIIVHKWFVDSRGWVVRELDAMDAHEAKKEAALLLQEHNEPFCSAAVKLIRLEKGEHMPRQKPPGEKLTFRERFVGRVL